MVSVIKLGIIAGAGTIFEIIGLMHGSSYIFFIGVVHLLEVPCMVLGMVGQYRALWLKGTFLGYLYTILVNGVLEVFWNMFGESGDYWIAIIFACVIVLAGSIIYIQSRKRNKNHYVVELTHNDIKISLMAFYDSGNHLKDPYTQKGVHIISAGLLSELAFDEDKKVYLPYQSLGNNNGLIEVYYIDFLQIYGQKNVIEQHKIPIGVAKEELFLNKSYKMILNEEVF